jgi:iron(III) transport system substrate-binding protein
MKGAIPGLFVLAALLIIPFALRPAVVVDDPDAETLVVLTPHNEAIRYEFERGFQRHMWERHQRKVRIDWRTPGGGSEIARYLTSEFRAAFELYWTRDLGRKLSEEVSTAFANPKQATTGTDEAASARREFLRSNVGVKVDVLFGGGSFEFSEHARAGRLVDSGILMRHPELFGDAAIPQTLGGEPYWDPQGRWVGACVSGFGICYKRDALRALGIEKPPSSWSDLADPRLIGRVALADPSKSGSANKAFEMLIQQAMAEAVARHGTPEKGSALEARSLAEGFEAGLLLIRKIGGNSRYFTDAGGKVVEDIAMGSAAAGMCIDFFGRFQSEEAGPARLSFVLPEGGSSLGSDPIALLRGAPSPALGQALIDFVMSSEGQALWAYRRGVPLGPERYALRRLPILPALYAPEKRALRSDPDDNPYTQASSFTYHPSWTGPYFRALAFVVRVMCVDTEHELHAAWEALVKAGFPREATALFEDMSAVSYQVVTQEVAPALAGRSALREATLQSQLVTALKAQYERVADLARSGR